MNLKKAILSTVAAIGLIGSAYAADLPNKQKVNVKVNDGDLIEIGVLTCNVEGGWGWIIGSKKDLECVFVSKDGIITEYEGKITRIGVDVGYVAAKTLVWSVVAASNGNREHPLTGNYVGAGVEASLMAGVGANALVGGFDTTIALQPINVQAQSGVNLAATVQAVKLY